MLCVVAVREAVTPPRVRAFPKVRVDLLVVVGIAAAAVALRFWDLGAQSYWYDEAITVDLVHGSFGHMLAGVHDHEATPPLYFALAWLWAHIFGDSETGLRSLSAVVGVLTVPVAYLVGREVAGRRTAVIVAAFAALSPALIWYSQEARSYALMVLLCALSLLFFVRALGETRRPHTRCGQWPWRSRCSPTTSRFSSPSRRRCGCSPVRRIGGQRLELRPASQSWASHSFRSRSISVCTAAPHGYNARVSAGAFKTRRGSSSSDTRAKKRSR